MKTIILLLLSTSVFAEEIKQPETIAVKPAITADMKHDIEVYNFGYQVCTFTKAQMSCVLTPQPSPTATPAPKAKK